LPGQAVLLAEEAVAGSEVAFNRLVDLFQEDIFRMAYYRTLSRMDAEDITQSVFIKAFKNISGLQSPERFKSWLFSIALNQVRDFYRKKRLLTMLGLSGKGDDSEQDYTEEDAPDPLDNLIKQDFWKHVSLFLDKLPRMEKEVFTLRFMNHLGIGEISSILKRNESTVKTHLYRALGKFRNETTMRQFLTEEKDYELRQRQPFG
ncbi:MAG: RNA polymerase sigma factor, partial [Syntrophobacterales bacterium]|nr:RNA polymerase sigma factor [Syntrophobacterales bacterium]